MINKNTNSKPKKNLRGSLLCCFVLITAMLIMISSYDLFASKNCSSYFSDPSDFDVDLAKNLIQYIKENDRIPTERELAGFMNISFKTIKEMLDGLTIVDVLSAQINFLDKIKKQILKEYASFSQERGVTISQEEFISKLDSSFKIFLIEQNFLFSNFQELKQASQLTYEKAFTFVLDDDLYNDEKREALLTACKTRSRLILTTAVAGAPVDQLFLNALLRYAEKNNADIIVFPANMQTSGLDPLLLSNPRIHILTNSLELSPFLNLNNIKIMAKQINPLTGLSRLGPRLQTQIIGSPKMHSEAVATTPQANEIHPRFDITTGAITLPNYNGKKEISRRTDAIASMDHVLGALILEKTPYKGFISTNIGDFNFRHIEYIPSKHGFLDIDTFYSQDSIQTKISPEAIVLGDLHIGDLNQELLDSLVQQILVLKPKYIILGDLFNGRSINHHDQDKVLVQASRAQKQQLNLKEELSLVIQFLNSLLKISKDSKLIIQSSNHNEWLKKWLNSGLYTQDPQNTLMGVALSYHTLIENIDPLETALLDTGFQEKLSLPILMDKTRVIYLQDGVSFRVAQSSSSPVEIGLHGHVGASGRKGSTTSMIKGTDAVVYGHTHSDFRKNKHVNIGTFTKKVLDYQQGFSSSINSLAIIGEDGQIQVLYFNNGSWYTRQNVRSKSFFQEGYPRIIPNRTGSDLGQLDQYSGSY